jgi:hypothetical protein
LQVHKTEKICRNVYPSSSILVASETRGPWIDKDIATDSKTEGHRCSLIVCVRTILFGKKNGDGIHLTGNIPLTFKPTLA